MSIEEVNRGRNDAAFGKPMDVNGSHAYQTAYTAYVVGENTRNRPNQPVIDIRFPEWYQKLCVPVGIGTAVLSSIATLYLCIKNDFSAIATILCTLVAGVFSFAIGFLLLYVLAVVAAIAIVGGIGYLIYQLFA